MRAGAYYAIAAALVLATVPMYRYIFQHARDVDRQQSARSIRTVAPAPVLAFQHVVQPMSGEKCYGGYLFAVSDDAVVQLFDLNNAPVPCAQDGSAREHQP